MDFFENQNNENQIPNINDNIGLFQSYSQVINPIPYENILENNNLNFSFPNITLTITFNIKFSNDQTFTFTDNPNNLFQSTFDKFIQENNLSSFKSKIKMVLTDGKTVDFNKTLTENNIKENSTVLFMIDDGNNMSNVSHISNISNISKGTNQTVTGSGFRFYGHVGKAGRKQNGEYKINQDRELVHLSVGNIKGFNLFGILDGHGQDGHFAAEFCKDYIIKKMTEFAEQCKFDYILTPEAIYNKLKLTNFQDIINCFQNADTEMGNQTKFDANYSGTTCNLVIQLNKFLICANVGDSRSIIINDDGTNTNQGICVLSTDHLPEIPLEKQRIINSGGMVDQITDQFGNKKGPYRVYPSGSDCNNIGLALSRSLGDLESKKYGVISQPDIIEYEINKNTKYLVIFSDGVWKYLTNEQIRDLGNTYYLNMDIKNFCTKLLLNSCEQWGQLNDHRDDMSVVSVFF